MESLNIKARISQGENTSTEFKESCDQAAINAAVAFANTGGGTIFLGVTDKKEISGIVVGKETLRNFSNQIVQATELRIILEIEAVEIAGKSVVLIHIAESRIKPVSTKGVCYKRVGNSNRVMSPQEIAGMHLRTVEQTWDQLALVKNRNAEIDADKIEWYLTQREAVRNVQKPQDMGTIEFLRNIGGVDTDDIPTNAGILFFGKYPQRFFYNAQLRVVRFKGGSVTHPVLDRLDCFGTLWEMVHAAEEFIRRNIRLLSMRTSKSFRRDDKFEYPLAALREAVINALIHRNYQETADVRVFIFDDRIEVINPGTFPTGVSPDKPVHNPVNPVLTHLMYDIGFIERYGSGIRTMRRLCREWGNKEPRYELHPLETKIIFESSVEDTTFLQVDDVPVQLSQRQWNALFYIEKNGQISTRAYMDINKVSRATAYQELKYMVNNSVLSMEGRGRATKYIKK